MTDKLSVSQENLMLLQSIHLLRQKIAMLISQKPELAVTIVSRWLKSLGPVKKKF